MSYFAIPYMGSKRKLAHQIVEKIIEDNPEVRYIWDLFGGGGAISFYALQRKQFKKVFYNEIDKCIVSLIKDIRDNGVGEKYYQWIDRETFHEHKNDDDWFGGLVKTCWSFGNNKEKGYLFSKENEIMKRPLHFAIVENDPKYLKDFENLTGIYTPENVLNGETVYERRINLMRYIKSIKNERFELQQIERLQQLQRLQQLEQLEQLELFNKSYDEVEITTPPENTIIYLDPPYENTGKYQHEIDHDLLKKYFNESPYKIYLSSYDFDGEEVARFEHRSSLSATANNKVIEKLYCNKPDFKMGEVYDLF